MATCFLSEHSAKKTIRKITVRNDLVDASCYTASFVVPGNLPVLVSTLLVHRLRALGAEAAVEKLKLIVNRGITVLRHNRNKKGNYVIDHAPQEFFAIERYYGGNSPSLVIDCVPLYAENIETELLAANG